jgi:hypothetical protein
VTIVTVIITMTNTIKNTRPRPFTKPKRIILLTPQLTLYTRRRITKTRIITNVTAVTATITKINTMIKNMVMIMDTIKITKMIKNMVMIMVTIKITSMNTNTLPNTKPKITQPQFHILLLSTKRRKMTTIIN